MILIDCLKLEFPSLNGIKTPTLPAIKQKNSFLYELTEFVELVELDVINVELLLTVNAETNRSEESIEFLKVIIIVSYC